MKKNPGAPDIKTVWVEITYDPHLSRITGKANESIMCNRGCPFFYVLHTVLAEYPEIRRRYAPGVLGFAVNGERPESGRPMRDGDVVEFVVCDTEAMVH
jgi:hypothetical protein